MTDQLKPRGRRSLPAHAPWVLLGVAAGIALGWLGGSWTTCEAHCGPDWNAVEGLGTWFGGIGTIVAVVYAGLAFRRDEDGRRAQELRMLETREERERADREEAELVSIVCVASQWEDLGREGLVVLKEFRVEIHNNANKTAIYQVSGVVEGRWVLDDHRAIPAGDKGETTIGPDHMVLRYDDIPESLAVLAARVTIRFKMNGKWWRRRGDEAVEVG